MGEIIAKGKQAEEKIEVEGLGEASKAFGDELQKALGVSLTKMMGSSGAKIEDVLRRLDALENFKENLERQLNNKFDELKRWIDQELNSEKTVIQNETKAIKETAEAELKERKEQLDIFRQDILKVIDDQDKQLQWIMDLFDLLRKLFGDASVQMEKPKASK